MQDYRAQARAIKALGAFWLTYTDSTPPARLERLTAKLQQAKYTPDTLYAAGVNERHHLSFISTPLEGIVYVLARYWVNPDDERGKHDLKIIDAAIGGQS
jgi:hypothetical protein